MSYQLLRHIGRYAQAYGHGYLKASGLNETEHAICSFLYGHDNVSQDDVARALLIDKTTVAKALSSLERRALVGRSANPDNRRKNILALTDEGRRQISELLRLYDEWYERVTRCLSPEESAQYERLTLRVCREASALDRSLPDPRETEENEADAPHGKV